MSKWPTTETGGLVVIPAETECRAYRWPREVSEATEFLAIYPTPADQVRT